MRLIKGNTYYIITNIDEQYGRVPLTYIGKEKGINKFMNNSEEVLILIKGSMIHYCNMNSIDEEIDICEQLGMEMFSSIRPMLFISESPVLMLTQDVYKDHVVAVEALYRGYTKLFTELMLANKTFNELPFYIKLINFPWYFKTRNRIRKLRKEIWLMMYAI